MASTTCPKAADHVEVAQIALPTRPPHPPAVGGTVRVLPAVTEVVGVAARAKDSLVEPMQAVAPGLVRVQNRGDQGADLLQPPFAPSRNRSSLLDQGVELVERQVLCVHPTHIRCDPPPTIRSQ